MKSQARVVVIGGGIAGCSTLYHLTREGLTDVVLLERDELTSGTTWHSAAQVTNFGMSQTMVALKRHSIALYRELAADTEDPITYHYGDGGIRLGNSQVVMDGYRHFVSLARGVGVDFEVIDAVECGRRHPLIETGRLMGGLWDPHDGDVDPAQLCQALVRRARLAGAEVYRRTPVTGLTQHADDSWTVHTAQGDIHCEMIVNAGGYRCNEVAAMMGVVHPVAAMEHQYFLTEPIPEIAALDRRLPLLRCPIDDFYCRQEKQGLLVGFYEQDCRTWGLDGIAPGFSSALCPSDTDRVLPVLENVFRRMPVLERAGIHTIVNGPITYTIDGAPLVGPVPGKRNAFCIVGLRAGLGEGGGHGWLLAQMIAHGEAEIDTWVIDPRRFGDHAGVELTALKAVEDYRNEFRFHLPHEHRPAGRPQRTTPLTPVLATEGAEFSVLNGWERASYFKPHSGFHETHGYRFNQTFDVIGTEVRAVQNGVGLAEVNGFTRIEITGSGAAGWLDALVCSKLAPTPGRVALAWLLNDYGGIKAEASIATLEDGSIWYGAAAAAEVHDMDWLEAHLPRDGSVRLRPLTDAFTTLVLAGPKSRAVLSTCARGDWSADAFRWGSVRRASIGFAPAVVMALSYCGELSYEIHVANGQLLAAFQALRKAGETHGLRLFGARAMDSMRLEKGHVHWKAELVTEITPAEAGLGRHVAMQKASFIGKTALAERKASKALVTLTLDCAEAPAQPGDRILSDGRVVGSVTSAGWGYRVGCNIALGLVEACHAAAGTRLDVEVIGRPVSGIVAQRCLYDSGNRRIRS